MTVIIQRPQQAQLSPSGQPYQRKSYKRHQRSSLLAPALRAGRAGGLSLAILILIGLIPPPANLPLVSLAILVIPGFFVVSFCTGLLAGIYAGDAIRNSLQGGQVGWMAGFWAGIASGIMAMHLAASGLLMVNLGQDLVGQFGPGQLAAWSAYVEPDTIALAGRVFGALVTYGLIGSLVSSLFSAMGGMIYPALSSHP